MLKYLKKTGPQALRAEEAETAKLIQTDTECLLVKAVDPQASKEEEEAYTAKLIQTNTECLGKAVDPQASREEEADTAKLSRTDTEWLGKAG